MKRLFAMMAMMFCCGVLPLMARADGAEDLWQGSIDAGGVKLRILLHVVKAAGGAYSGTLDSPDQGAKGIPFTVKSYDALALNIEVAAAGATFEGKLSKDGQTATGTWHQGGADIPLTLTRGGKAVEVRRPQTPKAPFPYHSEDVVFDSRPGVRLAGTLTLPQNQTHPVPAVLLISGSGPNNRNEQILNHQLFLVLADYLTRRGIGVLRYDKRGIGKSTGSYATATSLDFATDAEAGVAYLNTRKEVDSTKIGLIGHSEGGLIAPIVAGRNKNVAFIVLMAGPGLNGEEILYRQTALISKANGVLDQTIADNRKTQEKIFAIAKTEKDPVVAKRRMHALVDSLWNGFTEAQRAELKSKEPLYTQTNAVVNPWIYFFLTYDPVPTLQKVVCPVLALNGGRDLQVPPKEDLAKIEAALKSGGNKDYTITELPNLNHLFQTCKTGSPTEYGDIEETLAPVALQTMGDWIAAHTK